MLSYVAVVHMYKKKISVIFQGKDRIDAGKTPRCVSMREVTYFANIPAKRIFKRNHSNLFIRAQMGSIHEKNAKKSRNTATFNPHSG